MHAMTMTTYPLVKIIAIDMSFRDTGVCYMEYTQPIPWIVIKETKSFKCEPCGNITFDNLRQASIFLGKTVQKIHGLIERIKPDAIILELPCFSQNAKSAILIGMLWGALCDRVININLVEPSALKKWSNSKRGDEKKKVKEKVMSLCALHPKELSNDNIVDAVGLAFMFVEEIKTAKYLKEL